MPAPVTQGRTVAPSQPGLLPAAARRQVVEADRLIAELNANPTSPPSNPPQPQPVQVQQPAPAQHQAPPPPPANLQQPEPQADLAERLRLADQRFATLQGKYNAETALQRQQIDHQSALVTQLLERDARQTPPTPAPAALSPEDEIRSLGATDKEIEEYGELLPIVVRMARNMVKPTMEKLNAELTRVQRSQGTLAQDAVANRKLVLESTLDRDVPNWRLINESDHFLDWLNLVEVFSGVSRRISLTDAYNKLDAARVSGIFQAYVREYPAQSRAPGAPQVDPATLLAPDLRGGTDRAPEGAGGKRIWSESEIRNFYTRVRKKQVTPEEYRQTEQEIALATSEGRIRPDRPNIHANG